ncbi:glycosyltransferase family 2 protein [Xenorhabdus bovienii]|uniref:glycosyltransferase family 2 protein n=1 Tax=Xenorhabdus bovienii TaxID=40576 RepID=UPI0023B2BDDE|nr:glycosyltransferase family 2 protein [Xenorhabdus bovienii]MDE9550830.1 glycosyltransferase [Xenorhabdus bovienii]
MFLSICIPSYNRSKYLIPLLESIYNQDYARKHNNFEVVICEDVSPQRDIIISEFNKFLEQTKVNNLRLILNQENLGYDKNLRNCISQARGKYCLIMGNDDLLNENALQKVVDVLTANPDIVVTTRAYAWFKDDPKKLCDTVRHLPKGKLFEPGLEAIRFFFRRVGVISGFIVNTKKAQAIATEQFDGRLYYQMYLAGTLLTQGQGYYFSEIITLSRDSEAPDFGNAKTEKGIFIPGGYKPEGRLHMVGGLLDIAKYIETTSKIPEVYISIKKDLANYFYPYIRDQLSIPFRDYLSMINKFRQLGFNNEPFFYLHVILGFFLKKNGYDYLIKKIRSSIGSTPKIGF